MVIKCHAPCFSRPEFASNLGHVCTVLGETNLQSLQKVSIITPHAFNVCWSIMKVMFSPLRTPVHWYLICWQWVWIHVVIIVSFTSLSQYHVPSYWTFIIAVYSQNVRYMTRLFYQSMSPQNMHHFYASLTSLLHVTHDIFYCSFVIVLVRYTEQNNGCIRLPM